MPKLKTNRSVAKRFKFTKKKKIKASHAFRGHILSKKSRRRKRGLRRSAIIDSTDYKRISKLLPYGSK